MTPLFKAAALAAKASSTIMSVVKRDATTTVPVRPTEISRVLARRLFTSIGEAAAVKTAESYIEMYKRSGAQLRADAAELLLRPLQEGLRGGGSIGDGEGLKALHGGFLVRSVFRRPSRRRRRRRQGMGRSSAVGLTSKLCESLESALRGPDNA